MTRLPLSVAISSILGRKEDPGYRDIGHSMKVVDLRKLLGLTGSPMLYNYMNGTTEKIEPERALVMLYKFDVLVDQWLTIDELERDADNVELSLKVAREPIKEIIDELIDVDDRCADNHAKLRRGVRKLIAKYY